MTKINLGSGPRAVPGWVNLDGALGAKLQKLGVFRFLNGIFHFTTATWDFDIQLHDFRKPLKWPENSVDAVYTSHTLEHLSREDGQRLLQECFRVLKPSAVLRILVPDLAAHVKGYVEGRVPAEVFLEDLGVVLGTGKQGWKRVAARFVEFPHQCMYDTQALLRICTALGFECEERKAFDSQIDDIRTIELEDRTIAAVVIECRKPAT